MPGRHLLWLRDDLRLHDNNALAALAGTDITALYIVESTARPLGAASRWWLHHSLNALAKDLADFDIPLYVRAGDPREIISSFQPRTLAFHRRYHQPLQEIDEEISASLKASGTTVHAVEGFLLGEPDEVLTTNGTYYRVFTPFFSPPGRTHRPHPTARSTHSPGRRRTLGAHPRRNRRAFSP